MSLAITGGLQIEERLIAYPETQEPGKDLQEIETGQISHSTQAGWRGETQVEHKAFL